MHSLELSVDQPRMSERWKRALMEEAFEIIEGRPEIVR